MFDDDTFPFITDGIVKDTSDPQQNGRLKIWCPALDGEDFDIDLLPWAEYASPFGGVTNDFHAGRNKTPSDGPVSYGFWALPKIGAQVLVFLLNGDPNRRFCFASYFGLHRNRSLPLGRNKNPNENPSPIGPFTDSYDPLEPAYSNARTAFQSKMSAPQTKTRGVFERQVAQDISNKDGKDGYAENPVDGKYLDSQSYCFVTPGHHVFLMDDAPDNCRIRLKTCEGNQIIIDDTNERIYVSTAKGKTWIELDEDGHLHVFGSESVSVRSGKDINMYADRNFNVEAGKNVNIKAVTGEVKVSAKSNIHIRSTTGTIYQTACNEFHICSTNGYFVTAKEINAKSETSISASADGGAMHLKASGAINLDAGGGLNQIAADAINIKSAQGGGMSLGSETNMVTNTMKIKASSMELDAGGSLTMGASAINTLSSGGGGGGYSPFSSATPINPEKAAESSESTCSTEADSPSIVPGHEPWKRPASAKQRNKNWSE